MVNVNRAERHKEESNSDEEGSMEASSLTPSSGSSPDASDNVSLSRSFDRSDSKGFDSNDPDTSDSVTSSSSAESKMIKVETFQKEESTQEAKDRSVPRDTTSLAVLKLTGADDYEL
ncbi:hypothetical protein PF005_g2516 [Phytophthora fragariae]|uniref:Uncharacterized protein n=1 Tax=Phytophthora fragariae TaxID=53985 RepID=A0A6A3Z9R2_9STRA|nr:hypothetical protein PF003_g8271 [Phytophthora fragariae]KAE8940591.1 hypothetical protein PF009_g9600 [Phytophthora fragariae]KAE9015353.1 hypothetical protein PF011_g7657 [Phytophthora fragariae]KAE9118871.1 hypothetical protein PF010_g8064 [Phytophthora fragariae]KAE9132613.1 hypothetical protein PF006_g15241 [Phytophthora fragariae]